MEQETQKWSNDETETDDKWVHDSSIDHKGNIPLRVSTGSWKAVLFVISKGSIPLPFLFGERLTYFAIALNLVIYLSEVLQQDLKTAVNNVNYWLGATTLMPLFGAFLADAYFGRFLTILFSCIIYLAGLSLLTMSEFIGSLKPCTVENCEHPRKVHEVVFFIALYSISLGTGGYKPILESFGADQFDENHVEERRKKTSYFNWWNMVPCFGVLISSTVIVYMQDHIGWGVSGLILTTCMAIGFIVFYIGKPFYRYRVPDGSPLMPIFQVLVAAIIKRNLPHPSNPDLLYEVPESSRIRGRLLCHTRSLRFLDKAAIMVEDNYEIELQQRKHNNPWRLATVTMVEETKLLINMFPVWFTSLIFGTCYTQSATLFIKQCSLMNRKIGSFEVPPAAIVGSLGSLTIVFSIMLYEKILVPFLRRARGNERGLQVLERIGIGMAFPILIMAVAALVERKRLRMSSRGDGHMSAIWIAPQTIILGSSDVFAYVGMQEYFYEQVPESMRCLGMAFFWSVIGMSNLMSSFLITAVAHITEKCGGGWFGKDLNSSRVDKFYWLLLVVGALNLCLYAFFAKRQPHKSAKR